MLSAALRRGTLAVVHSQLGIAKSAAAGQNNLPLTGIVSWRRLLTTTVPRWSEKTDAENPDKKAEAAPSKNLPGAGEETDASRAALWDQMLNTIIVDPVENANADARLRKPRDALGSGLHAWPGSFDDNGISSTIMAQLENEFRSRPTIGPPTPATPTTGRSVSASNSYGSSSAAMLYRNLMGTLRRNNVRRELRLEERYEKPNQKRRRLRSERHRRRFADMIRKKVQLVCTCCSYLDYEPQSARRLNGTYPPVVGSTWLYCPFLANGHVVGWCSRCGTVACSLFFGTWTYVPEGLSQANLSIQSPELFKDLSVKHRFTEGSLPTRRSYSCYVAACYATGSWINCYRIPRLFCIYCRLW